MAKSRTQKYLNSVMYFSLLWGIKEFVLEPIISKLKENKNEPEQKRLDKTNTRLR
jgi:predicted oxidoreductase